MGDTTREALTDQFTVVTNTFMTVQLAQPHLRPGASIILMGSVYATMGPPTAGAYGASKAATSALARSLVSELAPRGIRVNVVVPGAIDTPSWGMETMGRRGGQCGAFPRVRRKLRAAGDRDRRRWWNYGSAGRVPAIHAGRALSEHVHDLKRLPSERRNVGSAWMYAPTG